MKVTSKESEMLQAHQHLQQQGRHGCERCQALHSLPRGLPKVQAGSDCADRPGCAGNQNAGDRWDRQLMVYLDGQAMSD